MDKICTFFGHREITNKEILIEKLKDAIKNLISNGFNFFYLGGFGDFDYLCYKILIELKKEYQQIQICYICEDYKYIERPSKRPERIQLDYDKYIYLPMEYGGFYKRIYFRNCEMVKVSDYVIFFVENTERSGAYKMLTLAKKLKKAYLNLGDLPIED